MKTWNGMIATIIVCALAIFFYKVTLTVAGILIILSAAILIDEMKNEYMKKKFRAKYCGHHFLSYSSNKRLKQLIEENLKSLIPIKFDTIYNNKNAIESKLLEKELRYLRTETHRLKLPILYKIEKDQVKVVSFYDAVSELKDQKITQALFEYKITKQLDKLNHGK